MMYEGTNKNGKEHGLAQTWHENGRLQSESNNKNGKTEGKVIYINCCHLLALSTSAASYK